jgi:hypothetical protein
LTTAICTLLPGGGCATSANRHADGRPIGSADPNLRATKGSMQASDYLGGMIFAKPVAAAPADAALAEAPLEE